MTIGDLRALPLLRVYIDETGDRGFGSSASPFFGIGAVMVPDAHDAALRAVVQELRTRFGITGPQVRWTDHLRPRHHSRRKLAASLLAAVPEVKVVHVVLDKHHLPPNAEMRGDHQRAYSYTSRLLFERIAEAASNWNGGAHRAIVRVSHAKGIDHPSTIQYLTEVCPMEPTGYPVRWELVTCDIKVLGNKVLDGLQAADLHCGIFNAALQPDEFAQTSPEYLLTCAHQLHRNSAGKVLGYGIKVLGDRGSTLVTSQPWWSQL